MDIIIIYLLILIIPLIASINVRNNYSKFKKQKSSLGITGFEVARKILDENGLANVYIVESPGELTDCYDPLRKTVRLSTDIFHGNSISAVAIAAHECGHAIQDKESYFWMKIRSSIFPIVSICDKIAYVTLLFGIILHIIDLIYLAVALTVFSLVFQIITLPVEYDASDRAKKILKNLNMVDDSDNFGIKKVLNAAVYTYIAGVLTTVLQMIYYLLSANNRKR